jgi:hypothetical protein
MLQQLKILSGVIGMICLMSCDTASKSVSAMAGYRIVQVTEEKSLSEGVGKIMGVVKDVSTGERINQGEVVLLTNNQRFPLNSDGSFAELIPAGKHVVAIESEGYSSITTSNLLIRTKTSTYLNILLKSSKSDAGPGRTN